MTKDAPEMPDLAQSPYWGVGGRYTYDPATGIHAPQDDADSAGLPPALTEPEPETSPVKGKQRG